MYARTFDELRPWLAPQVASGPMEIAMVGDFDVDEVIAEISKTFGALPAREPMVLDPARTVLNFPLESLSTYAFYAGADDRPSTLEFFWPVRDPLGVTQRRHLQLLADILENRVADQIRENKGATYSPNGFLMWNDTYPGFNFVRCTLDVQPEKAMVLGDTIRDLVAQLARRGVKQDELARVKAQHLAQVRASETDNGSWLDKVADAQQRPWRIDDVRSRLSDIESASVTNLNALARLYLGADKPFRYIIDPAVRMPKK
jgi:zinc protease